MAGDFFSALGASILGGQQAYQQADFRQRALAQQQFENDRQTENDKLAREQFVAKQKMDALQSAILNDTVKELPKKHAEGDIKSLIELEGPINARNNPAFVDAAKVMGLPLQTAPISPRQAKVNAIEGNTAPLGAPQQPLPSTDPLDTGIAPDTGVRLNPADITAARDLKRKDALDQAITSAVQKFSQPGAMNNLFEMDAKSGLPANSPGNRMKAQQITKMTGGQVPVPDLDKMYGPPKTESWRVEHQVDPINGSTSWFRVNDADGSVQPIHGAGGSSGGGVEGLMRAGVTGEDVLKGVSPQMASIVRQLTDYSLPTNARALTAPSMRYALAVAKAYDPSFDSAQYDIRQATKKGYASGKEKAALDSLNKMVMHTVDLEEKAKALNNNNGFAANANAVENFIGSNIMHNPAASNFEQTLNNAREEATKFLTGNNPTDQTRNAQGTGITRNSADKEIQGYIDTLRKLALEQGGELQRSYNTRMGGKQMPVEFFNPTTQAFFQKYGVNSNVPGATPAQAAPQSGMVTLIAPDGKSEMPVNAADVPHYVSLGAKVKK